jgi:O-antigen/teichoic acid export membrane protein
MGGNLVYGITQWLILVLLARTGRPEDVGRFSLGLAITGPLMLFASLSLRAVQATDTRTQFEFRDYAGLRILTTLAATVVILSISCIFYNGETATTIGAFGLSKAIESMSDIVYGFWQQQERMDLIARSLMARGSTALAGAAILFHSFRSVPLAVFGIAAGWAIVLAIFDLPHGIRLAHQLGQRALPRFCLPLMKQLAWLSLPLGIIIMLISLDSNIPRYLLSRMRTMHELGIFSALGYFLLAGTLVVNALGQSATPRLALYSSQGRKQTFFELSNRLLLLGLGLGVSGILVAVLAGRQLLTLLYGAEYARNSGLFVWLMIAGAFSYTASFAGYSLTAARHFRIQLPLFSLITGLTFVLCFVMVKIDGATGVAKALAAAGLLQTAATIGLLRYLEAEKANT